MTHLLDFQNDIMKENANRALDLYEKNVMDTSSGMTILRYATNGFWYSEDENTQNMLDLYYWQGIGGFSIIRHARENKSLFQFRGKK